MKNIVVTVDQMIVHVEKSIDSLWRSLDDYGILEDYAVERGDLEALSQTAASCDNASDARELSEAATLVQAGLAALKRVKEDPQYVREISYLREMVASEAVLRAL